MPAQICVNSDRVLRVEYRPLENLIPYARNARTHSDAQVAQIAASTIHHHDEPVPVADPPAEPVVERAKKPRKKRPEPAAKPKTEADMLLDSVLSALPEPKAPGQGRSRRRVSTAALTGTPVAHKPAED